jgi:uncharacterized membrane protein YfcA
MLPTVLMGSYLGVIINVILPALILQVVLTILLIGLTIQSSLKAREIFKKENVVKLRQK